LIGYHMELFSFTLIAWEYIKPLNYEVIKLNFDFSKAQKIKLLIDESVLKYLHRALQIDPESIKRLEHGKNKVVCLNIYFFKCQNSGLCLI